MWRRVKIAFWMVVLTVAPIVLFYAIARFLSDKAANGEWGWLALWLIAGPAAGFAVDFFNGRYALGRKSRQELLPPVRNWEDGPSRSD